MKDRVILTPYFLDSYLPGLEALAEPAWELNKQSLPDDEQQQRMSKLHQPLATAVSQTINQNKRPVSIAGDCCTTIGVLAGLQHAGVNPTLIWFDAHGDFNTWETTPSKFLGGMPLAMLVGKGELTMNNAVGLSPLPEDKVILTDGRDLDPGEKMLVDASAVQHIPDMATLLTAPLPDGPLYVHFDVDVLDPSDAPAMNYPAPDGPSISTIEQLFKRLAATGRITAVSVSAWNPEMDGNGRSQNVIMPLLDVLLG
ncbi:MAG: arginase [Chloroflexi bacterium]|nr:arginase [Chloroflexota bacterium]